MTTTDSLQTSAILGEFTTLRSKDFNDLDIYKLLKIMHQLCYTPSGGPTKSFVKILLESSLFKALPGLMGLH